LPTGFDYMQEGGEQGLNLLLKMAVTFDAHIVILSRIHNNMPNNEIFVFFLVKVMALYINKP
jgi:hypothetical protein